MNISRNMKELRKQKGWSQSKLATKTGLSINCITKLEQQAATHPTIQTMVKLADAFNVKMARLIK